MHERPMCACVCVQQLKAVYSLVNYSCLVIAVGYKSYHCKRPNEPLDNNTDQHGRKALQTRG